jgi:hypothetical protein
VEELKIEETPGLVIGYFGGHSVASKLTAEVWHSLSADRREALLLLLCIEK